MIRHFQEMYFDSNYSQTIDGKGYEAPDFGKIAAAYGIKYKALDMEKEMDETLFQVTEPVLMEVFFTGNTYVFPKLEFGKPNQDQEPLLDRDMFHKLMEL